MDLSEARDIVKALANGIDPTTGELLPDTSPVNNARVIRALFMLLDPPKNDEPQRKTIEDKHLQNLNANRPRNAGLPWTTELKNELAIKFQSGLSIAELAKYFERTQGAITAELVKQHLIEP